ncbi:MAG: hypothetical protein GY738_26265, partial [Pseudoalteromonas sp.]|nr:hypothetical protein [Pseudoalteromonas sp.]
DDSMDMTFQNRTSVLAQFDRPEYIEKNKSRAPPGLAHSLATFKGPQGNENWINVRETTLTAAENAILDQLDIIPDRKEFLKILKPGRQDAVLTVTEQNAFDKNVFERGQRWDSDFMRDTKDWNGTSDFESWFKKFWRTAKQNKIDDVGLFKDQLFDKIHDAKGDDLGPLLCPSNNKSASALKYYLQIRRLVIPVADPEMAAGMFYSLKQGQ